MTPETALNNIPGFSNARVSMVLADGPTNKTVLVEYFDSRYVLRVDKPAVQALGLNRLEEEKICRMVAAAGMAPEPVYYDHANGVSLRCFVGGTNWLESDLRNVRWLRRLAGLLRHLHNLPAVDMEFKPGEAIERYAKDLDTEQARHLADRAQGLLGEAKALQDAVCLCHNDLLNHNILDSNQITLIDWEFAGMGDPWFDLAVVVQHHALGEKLGKQFLAAYLARSPSEAELARLWKNCEFYAVLLELWLLRIKAL